MENGKKKGIKSYEVEKRGRVKFLKAVVGICSRNILALPFCFFRIPIGGLYPRNMLGRPCPAGPRAGPKNLTASCLLSARGVKCFGSRAVTDGGGHKHPLSIRHIFETRIKMYRNRCSEKTGNKVMGIF